MASINSRLQPTTPLPAAPKAPAAAAPAPTPNPAGPPAPSRPTDSTLVAPPQQGSAATDIALFTPADSEPAIKAWKDAAGGPQVDLSAADAKSKIGKLLALRDSVTNGNYTPQQKKTFAGFVQQMMNQAPSIDPSHRNATLHLLNDMLEHKGISQGQLDMILDGRFKARDMWNMMLSGDNTAIG